MVCYHIRREASISFLPAVLPSIKAFPKQAFLPSFSVITTRGRNSPSLSFPAAVRTVSDTQFTLQISNIHAQLLCRLNGIATVGPRYSYETPLYWIKPCLRHLKKVTGNVRVQRRSTTLNSVLGYLRSALGLYIRHLPLQTQRNSWEEGDQSP